MNLENYYMPKSIHITKRSELDTVLTRDTQKARMIIIPSVIILTILTVLSYLGYFNHLWSSVPWLASITTTEVLVGLDAMAILGLLNLRFKPDIWLSSIFSLPIAAIIWIVARSIVVTTYLTQSAFQEILHNAAINAMGKNAEQIIYGAIAEQNFTIVSIFLMLSLWAAFFRILTRSTYTAVSTTTMIVLGALAIFNAVRFVYAIPNFFTIWVALLAISLVFLTIMIGESKGNHEA